MSTAINGGMLIGWDKGLAGPPPELDPSYKMVNILLGINRKGASKRFQDFQDPSIWGVEV